MVAKISLGDSLYGAIRYNGEKLNKEKGRLLDTNKIYNDGSGAVDIRRVYNDFMRWMPANTKTMKPMMHISLNPHPDDRLSDTDYTSLAHEYMRRMGFGDMPYIVVKHMDIDRHHIHIVALRVGTDGKAVSDRNNFYRSKDICRELEREFGLRPAERQKVSPDTPIVKIDPAGDLKRQVANVVKLVGMRYRFQSIGEMNAVLSLFNVRAEMTDGRVNGCEYHGLVYFATDDSGTPLASPFKASRLGKFASRAAVDGRFERSRGDIADRHITDIVRRRVDDALLQCSDRDSFVAGLRAVGIDVVFRLTDTGRIYGVTFIDHSTMCVLNGSRLGKEYSANAFERRFNGSAEAVVDTTVPVPETETYVRAPQTEEPAPQHTVDPESDRNTADPRQQTANTHTGRSAERDTTDDMPSIPGLDLFHVGPGFDAEEEAFYRAMRRRRRRGRKPGS